MKWTPAQRRVLIAIRNLNDLGKRANKSSIGGTEPTYMRLRQYGLIISVGEFASMFHTCKITDAGRAALAENGGSG